MTLPPNPAESDPIGPAPSPSGQDVLPHGERDQDELRSDITHELTNEPARPLTHEEQQAASHDAPRSERVYAPASERVPKTYSGHRDMVEHPDESTPERRATGAGAETQAPTRSATDGVVRTSRGRRRVRIPIGSSMRERHDTQARQSFGMVGLAWVGLFAAGALAVVLVRRWQHERNRPINRLRRQARWATQEIRDHAPNPPETMPSTMTLAAALLSTGLVLWRRLHASGDQTIAERATQTVADQEWQKRLAALRARWTPHRVQAEASLTFE